MTKNAGKACNNRLYRHIRTFEKIVKNYFVIYDKILWINCNGILQQIQKWEEEQRYILQKCKVRAESVRYFDGSSGTFFL